MVCACSLCSLACLYWVIPLLHLQAAGSFSASPQLSLGCWSPDWPCWRRQRWQQGKISLLPVYVVQGLQLNGGGGLPGSMVVTYPGWVGSMEQESEGQGASWAHIQESRIRKTGMAFSGWWSRKKELGQKRNQLRTYPELYEKNVVTKSEKNWRWWITMDNENNYQKNKEF